MQLDDLTALRRDLHAHAEPAFLEIRTAATVLARLRGLPYRVIRGGEAMRTDAAPAYPGEEERARAAERAIEAGADPADARSLAEEGTALVAEVEGDRPGPTWGLRFDMDALPLREADDSAHAPAALGFRSRNEGCMHACGHDGHVAMGVGLAHRLADRAFPGRVRFFFQPAEEGGRGARAMLAAGVADGVDRFVAVHLGLGLAPGVVTGGLTGGFATTKLRVSFTGRASHAAAAPQEGRNALAAAASALLGVLALPRYSTADTRVNVGTLHGGDNVNIVPAHAHMTCEARATDDAVNEDLTQRVERVVRGAAEAYGVGAEVERIGGSATFSPDPELVERINGIAESRYGPERVMPTHPMGGSDDASLFMRAVQERGGLATYMGVGAGNPAPHHNPFFDIDESVLPVAVEVLEELIRAGG